MVPPPEEILSKILLASTGLLGAFMAMAVEKPKSMREAFAALICGFICAYFFAAPITRYLPILDVNDADTVSAMGLIVGMVGIFIVQTIVGFAKGEPTPLGKNLSNIKNTFSKDTNKKS